MVRLRDGEAVVAHDGFAFAREETVRGLHVPMQHTPRMSGFQSINDAENGIHRLTHGQGATAFHFIPQGATRRHLHGDHRHTFDFLRAEDIDAVRMIDRRGETALTQEALALLLVVEALIQHLQSQPATTGDLFRFINNAHAACAELFHQTVTTKIARQRRDTRADRLQWHGFVAQTHQTGWAERGSGFHRRAAFRTGGGSHGEKMESGFTKVLLDLQQQVTEIFFTSANMPPDVPVRRPHRRRSPLCQPPRHGAIRESVCAGDEWSP